jgi:hypothetical protein
MTQHETLQHIGSIHEREPNRSTAAPLARYSNGIIYFSLVLFVLLLPYSIKGARRAWMAAFVTWLITLAVRRTRMFEQPLVLPMLAYVVFSGISTAMSYDPYLSWGHMKLVCYGPLVCTVFAQNLSRLSQVRTLVILLLLSATSAACFTAWQYTYGLGVRVKFISPQTQLFLAGIRTDDIIVGIDGHAIHTPKQLADVLSQIPPDAQVHVDFLRGVPTRKHATLMVAGDYRRSGLGTDSLSLARAKPVRAQGTLGHYGIFAEVLMPIGCLAWALLLSTPSRSRWLQFLFAFIFLALTATIFATQTRAAIVGLLGGCTVILLSLAGKRARIWAATVLFILAVGAYLWIHLSRGINWIDLADPGTNYRLLMWKDGLRLALQHPAFGVGMESIQNHWQAWHLQAFAVYHVFYNFHSDIVQIAAERGLLTLAAWLWLVVAYLIYLTRVLKSSRQQSRFATAILAGILGGFLAFLVTSLVESCLNDDSLVMLLFFGCGVAVAVERILKDPYAIDVKHAPPASFS